jgi:hypothetical protein
MKGSQSADQAVALYGIKCWNTLTAKQCRRTWINVLFATGIATDLRLVLGTVTIRR